MEMNQIKQKFIDLVNKYGKDGELFTFEYCANKSIDLADSTIDIIRVVGNNNISFVYNENENDYDTIGAFELSDLYDFYDEIEEAILMDLPKYKDAISIENISYDEYWENLMRYFAVGDKILYVEGDDMWEGDEVIEFRNSCGCLLSKFNVDKNIALHY